MNVKPKNTYTYIHKTSQNQLLDQINFFSSLTTDDCMWTNENELSLTKIDHQAIGGNSPSARWFTGSPFPQLSFRTCRFSVESWQISGGW